MALFVVFQKQIYSGSINTLIDQNSCALSIPLDAAFHNLTAIYSFLEKYECKNPCQETVLDTPFFRPSDIPRLQPPSPSNAKQSSISRILVHTSIPLIILQSIYGFLLHVFTKKLPHEVRNASFAYFQTTRLHRNTMLYCLSLGLHVSIHFVMIFIAAFSIPWFFFLIGANEAYISVHDTEEESPAAVGQWSPRANTGLLLIAALINRYHHTWTQHIWSWISGPEDIATKEDEEGNDQPGKLKGVLQSLYDTIQAPYLDLSSVVAEEWWDLLAFVSDPDVCIAVKVKKVKRHDCFHEGSAMESLSRDGVQQSLTLVRRRSRTLYVHFTRSTEYEKMLALETSKISSPPFQVAGIKQGSVPQEFSPGWQFDCFELRYTACGIFAKAH